MSLACPRHSSTSGDESKLTVSFPSTPPPTQLLRDTTGSGGKHLCKTTGSNTLPRNLVDPLCQVIAALQLEKFDPILGVRFPTEMAIGCRLLVLGLSECQ